MFAIYKNCRSTNISSKLITNDYQDALHRLVRNIQSDAYSDEFKLLQKSVPFGSSKFASLYPFICKAGFIRVGGRLRNANIDFDHKHPILLPRENHLTKLIIRQMHYDTLHGGLKLMLATLRQRYWVTNARTSI